MKTKSIILILLMLALVSCTKDYSVPEASVKITEDSVEEDYTTSTLYFTVNSTISVKVVSCVLVPVDGGEVVAASAKKIKNNKYSLSYTSSDGFDFKVRFVVSNDYTVYECAEVFELKTKAFQVPEVTTDKVDTTAGSGSVVFYGTIQEEGGKSVSEYGFCFCRGEQTPTTSDFVVQSCDLKNKKFTYTVSELEQGYTYSVRAYAKNEIGVSYGKTIQFTR